jgi:hypothetical protein
LIPGNLPREASPVQYQYIEKVACLVNPPPGRESARVSALPADNVVEVIPRQTIAEITARLLNMRLF